MYIHNVNGLTLRWLQTRILDIHNNGDFDLPDL